MSISNLAQGVGSTFPALFSTWVSGTLPAALSGFAAALKPTFNDAIQNPDRPVGEWLAIIASYGAVIPSGFNGSGQPNATWLQLVNSAQAVTQLFSLATTLTALSGAQTAALIAAFNAYI